jgi:hypothetical protein
MSYWEDARWPHHWATCLACFLQTPYRCSPHLAFPEYAICRLSLKIRVDGGQSRGKLPVQRVRSCEMAGSPILTRHSFPTISRARRCCVGLHPVETLAHVLEARSRAASCKIAWQRLLPSLMMIHSSAKHSQTGHPTIQPHAPPTWPRVSPFNPQGPACNDESRLRTTYAWPRVIGAAAALRNTDNPPSTLGQVSSSPGPYRIPARPL